MKKALIGWFLCSICVLVQALELRGAGVYRALDNDIYLGGVFSSSTDPSDWLKLDHIVRLELNILADTVNPRHFRRLWNNGFAINLSDDEMKKSASSIQQFARMLTTNLMSGDWLTISNESGVTECNLNGVNILTLDDPGFTRLLLLVWLSKFPQSPSFKNALLDGEDKARQIWSSRQQQAYKQSVSDEGYSDFP